MDRKPLTMLDSDKVSVAPSVLAADFSRLGDEIRAIEAGDGDVVHLDIMDGHFVPNISLGPPVVQAIRPVTQLPFDVHLMLTHPGRYIDAFLTAGADHITLHIESEGDMPAMLGHIHAAGASAGLTLRPGTSEETIFPYLDCIDLVLVMTVEPGFGGQSFMADMMPKIRRLRAAIDAGSRPVHLEVDGGIAPDTVQTAVDAGGRMLVAGSSVFRSPAGIPGAIAELKSTPIVRRG